MVFDETEYLVKKGAAWANKRTYNKAWFKYYRAKHEYLSCLNHEIDVNDVKEKHNPILQNDYEKDLMKMREKIHYYMEEIPRLEQTICRHSIQHIVNNDIQPQLETCLYTLKSNLASLNKDLHGLVRTQEGLVEAIFMDKQMLDNMNEMLQSFELGLWRLNRWFDKFKVIWIHQGQHQGDRSCSVVYTI